MRQNKHSLKVVLAFGVCIGKILARAWIFLLALPDWSVLCLLKLFFLSIVTPGRFWEPTFSSMQAGSKNFVLMSRLDKKFYLSLLVSIPYSWKHLKRFTEAFCNFFLFHIGFFSYIVKGCHYQHDLQYLQYQLWRTYQIKTLNKMEPKTKPWGTTYLMGFERL